jgi:hypothetical protein
MKNEQLKTLGQIKKILAKAEMAKEIHQYLSEEDMVQVIDSLLEKGLSVNGDLVYLSLNDLNIQVHNDLVEFEEAATLKQLNYSFSYSPPKSDRMNSLGWVIVGDVEYGEYNYSRYSENGDVRSPSESYKAPEFSIDKKQVILVRIKEDDTYNNRDNHSVTYYLHIYQPNTYQLPNWVRELADRFDW